MTRALLGIIVAAGLLAAPSAEAPVVEQPAGTLIFVTGTNVLTAIDVATGRRTKRAVEGMAACGPQLEVTDGHLVFSGIDRRGTVVFSVPVALDRPPRRLGRAHQFTLSATPGRVWLAGTDCSNSDMTGAREVSVDGTVAFETDRRFPRGAWMTGAVPGGLVLHRGRRLSVWDPRTGRAGPPLALQAVTAGRGSLLAGCDRRGTCDDLTVQETTGGDAVRADADRIDFGAEFSPDGSRVAAPQRDRRRWRVVLMDTASGAVTAVRGSRSREYPELGWSASSGWLFARAGRRILAYHPDRPRALTLPLRAPRRASAFVAG
jgi:hypothetical protein